MSSSILVVEDDDALVRSIDRNLVARGHTVQSAGTVAAALTLVGLERPDLVLLDVDLPDGSGWEVLRSLRSGPGEDVAVIVLSGLRPNPRYIQELRCAAILEKPFPMDSLLRLVSECLGTSGAKVI